MSVEIQGDLPSSKKYEDEKICSQNELEPKLDTAIKNICNKEGFIKYKINTNMVSSNGGSYLGDLYEIDVKGETKEGSKELNLFVKKSVPTENNMTFISVSDAYRREMLFYKEFSKVFNDLEDKAQVPQNERFKMVKCYDETNTDFIIMENVAKQGFRTGHRMDVVTIKFAELSIRELAKFHAFSFILEIKRPEYFESRIKTLKSPFNGEDKNNILETSRKIIINYIDEKYKKRVETFCEGIVKRFIRSFEDGSANRCLCHNDYRPNNILAKINNGEVSDIIPVDYQLVSYACPLLDFFYFIFGSTDKEFRRAHLQHLKNLYFETLTQFLKYFDIDVNLVYPRKEFEKDYKEKLEHGMIVSIFCLPFLFVIDNEVPDIVKNDIAALNFQLDDKVRDRIRGNIEDFIEWGVL